MAHPNEPVAWLETQEGKQVPIKRTCSLGRSSSNDLVLKNEKISRRHAIIHTQEENEYWLVDFGSANGTLVNGRRITQPTRLRDTDVVELAEARFCFRQPRAKEMPVGGRPTSRSTSFETKTVTCWLLVTDIISSSQMSQHSDKDLPVLLGKWFLECKRVIDENGGTINKFLGDGLFAYWLGEPAAAGRVAKALAQFAEAQKLQQPAFRLAVHCGEVSLGGSPLMMEELFGRNVNFVFRMEKLAAKLGAAQLLSAEARELLAPHIQSEPLGSHEIAGFRGEYSFFRI